ncbi:8445_t:CDS:2 [Cetraspora pellucida]|uniref:8445_t:CDS:1 n=1 Tax=Cetraspora pellucida TaxID=1433469 RepID=A0A9N8ZFV7_9GLOM|nr:8445_t:CDS:2 [Cetraspora pellucida]
MNTVATNRGADIFVAVLPQLRYDSITTIATFTNNQVDILLQDLGAEPLFAAVQEQSTNSFSNVSVQHAPVKQEAMEAKDIFGKIYRTNQPRVRKQQAKEDVALIALKDLVKENAHPAIADSVGQDVMNHFEPSDKNSIDENFMPKSEIWYRKQLTEHPEKKPRVILLEYCQMKRLSTPEYRGRTDERGRYFFDCVIGDRIFSAEGVGFLKMADAKDCIAAKSFSLLYQEFCEQEQQEKITNGMNSKHALSINNSNNQIVPNNCIGLNLSSAANDISTANLVLPSLDDDELQFKNDSHESSRIHSLTASLLPTNSEQSLMSSLSSTSTDRPLISTMSSTTTDRSLMSQLSSISTDRSLIPALPSTSTDRSLASTLPSTSTDRSLVPTMPLVNSERSLVPTMSSTSIERSLVPTMSSASTERSLVPTMSSTNAERSLVPTMSSTSTERSLVPTMSSTNTDRSFSALSSSTSTDRSFSALSSSTSTDRSFSAMASTSTDRSLILPSSSQISNNGYHPYRALNSPIQRFPHHYQSSSSQNIPLRNDTQAKRFTSLIYEKAQARRWERPIFDFINAVGGFYCKVTINNLTFTGKVCSKKADAKEDAAEIAYCHLVKNDM